jgi:hypothetical protein
VHAALDDVADDSPQGGLVDRAAVRSERVGIAGMTPFGPTSMDSSYE